MKSHDQLRTSESEANDQKRKMYFAKLEQIQIALEPPYSEGGIPQLRHELENSSDEIMQRLGASLSEIERREGLGSLARRFAKMPI